MNRLLIATDLSERSDRAIDRAIMLAKRFGAHLTVLHVIDEDLPATVADKQKEVAQRNLQEHLQSMSESTDLHIDLVIDFGKDWSEILRQANAARSELIVLGMHRETGVGGLFRGTTVERVVRNGNTPTLVVKNKAVRDYRTSVVGVDFSIYSRRAIEFALGFAPDATINLVHAYEPPFKVFLKGPQMGKEFSKREEREFNNMIEQEMAGFLAGLDFGSTMVAKSLREGGPDQVIHESVAGTSADLLVLGTHGRTGVAHAFLGSVAERFLTNPPCDVVAVKAW